MKLFPSKHNYKDIHDKCFAHVIKPSEKAIIEGKVQESRSTEMYFNPSRPDAGHPISDKEKKLT